MKIKLSEVVKSIQGEGVLQGVPSVFLRFIDCNLSCAWCDTPGPANPDQSLIFDEFTIREEIKRHDCRNIVITGGEPMLNSNIGDIVSYLKKCGYHITIETNATIIRNTDCDLISMSPKLKNSIPQRSSKGKNLIELHKRRRFNLEAIKYYIENHNYQIKFVLRDQESEFDEVRQILDQLESYDPHRVMIMPMSNTSSDLATIQKRLVSKCIKYNFRYANRLQLQIWSDGDDEVYDVFTATTPKRTHRF